MWLKSFMNVMLEKDSRKVTRVHMFLRSPWVQMIRIN
jgi:hypothetical protein